ncbi:MAG: hypothetical protein ACRDLS_04860 [Solirubrobacteraceae bacterium]
MTPQPEPFAANRLRVREGTLEGAIRWGEAEGDDPLLLHAITLLLAPLRVGDQDVPEPKLRLHSLRLPVSSWAQLAGGSYPLGNVVREIVADGESHPVYDAYGSLKLGDVYHEVVPSLVSFEPRDGCALALHVEGRIEPADAPPSFAPVDFAIDADVALAAVRVVGDAGAAGYPSQERANPLAERLLDVDDYEPPVVEDGCVVLHPRCRETVVDAGT